MGIKEERYCFLINGLCYKKRYPRLWQTANNLGYTTTIYKLKENKLIY